MDSALRLQDMAQRLAVLEAESAIRRLMARYMDLCDVPHASVQVDDLAALFTADAVWEGIGSLAAKSFGRQHGRQAVAVFVASYLPPVEHFALNLHLLTSESIAVNGDAETASGQWIMQQISRYSQGGSELFCARLNIDFACVEGQWLIAHFRTCRLFNMQLAEPSV
ncbi:nuclear transport factor 2 family protein [Pseudomonas sp. EL_65y_Pfl2_R95]|uniref:nuclear transport factor 2 family protein n=1 Tax=Pseudomonas sp. EL_65y_Pfl2_R95 TaxID=3088698 RepID=UPI0030D92A19